jgi:hypothetical protein
MLGTVKLSLANNGERAHREQAAKIAGLGAVVSAPSGAYAAAKPSLVGYGLIRDVPTVQKLIDRIMNEPERLIRGRLTGFLDTDTNIADSRVTRRRARSTLRRA